MRLSGTNRAGNALGTSDDPRTRAAHEVPGRRPGAGGRPRAPAGRPRDTSSPVSPSTTISGTPPTRVATTGRPAAIASRIETGSASLLLERTKTCDEARIAGMSFRSPANTTGPSSPSRRRSSSAAGRSGPSPTRSARYGPRSSASARRSVIASFGAWNLPTGHDHRHTHGRPREWARADIDAGVNDDRPWRIAGSGVDPRCSLGLGDADRHRRQWTHSSLRKSIEPGVDAGVRAERPAVDREDANRNTGEPSGDSPQHACLRAARVHDVGAHAPHQAHELDEAEQIARRDRATDVAKLNHLRSRCAGDIGDRPVAVRGQGQRRSDRRVREASSPTYVWAPPVSASVTSKKEARSGAHRAGRGSTE